MLQGEKTHQEIVLGHSQFVVSWNVALCDSMDLLFSLSKCPDLFGKYVTKIVF